MIRVCRIGKLLDWGVIAILSSCLVGCGAAAPAMPTAQGGASSMTFTLTSPSFVEGEAIPVKHTCDGANQSPALRWEGAPDARSFALIVDDPDAPGGTFTHWVLFDIPGALRELP